jgi:hypothetical protein
MSQELMKSLETLVKTLEAGNYNVAPGQLVQGSALQIENLEPVMRNVTFDDSHIKLQKMFSVEKTKSLLVQYNRQLSYGRFGGSAMREGAVGSLDVGDYVRATMPMCFYSSLRRVTIAANMVETIDGKKAEDREMENAAIKLAGDIEFDSFGGKSDFSNAGVFDGNPYAIAEIPNMLGLDTQVRMSDNMVNTQDLMFDSFGSNRSVVIPQNGGMDQVLIEEMLLRSRLNMGKADQIITDPITLSGYNRRTLGYGSSQPIQRIVLGGSAQDASGADLRRQWTSSGTASIEDSRFLVGQTKPKRARIGAPAAPTISVQPAASGSGASIPAGTYVYVITAQNEQGEGSPVVATAVAVTSGQQVALELALQTGVTHFSVYRGTTAANAGLIGHVKMEGTATTTFVDLGNRASASAKAFLVQKDTAGFAELAPFSRQKLAQSDLSQTECAFRFLTLTVFEPRKNIIADNLVG